MEPFSTSQNEQDDEEALKWASLERLPTYARLRKGILTSSKGHVNEIDINSLSFHDRTKLIQRLINVADVDNHNFLSKLRHRIDR